MPRILRDPRLHGMSSDHHHALILAMRTEKMASSSREDEVALARVTVARAFERELAPHFEIEERILLPALRAAGEEALVERTLAEHRELRRLALAEEGDARALLRELARLLEAHVRFEERELFETAQRVVDPRILEAVARERPKPRI